ncbi:MAG: hypothetical protein RR272_03365, partial [Synergistaceae bacterium]
KAEVKKAEVKKAEVKKAEVKKADLQKLENMSVTALRKLAIEKGIKGMTNKEIRKATKAALIAAIADKNR